MQTEVEAHTTKASLERSSVDEASNFDSKISLKVARRTLRFITYVRQLLMARIALGVLILLAALPIPWLFKILIDHGVMAMSISEAELYPFFMYPLLNLLADSTPLQIAGATCCGLGAIFIFFGYATNTELHARLAQGADVATQSENKTNDGFSAASGVVGFLDFRLHVKISQQITHKVRSELFAKLSQLPVVSLVKQRAGDAVFRVMHDAPSLGIICMSLIVQPIFFIFSALLGLWILWSVYGTDAPELVWLGASAIFVTLFITLPFTRWIRRLSHQSRISGSEVVNFTEEGIRNKKVIQSLGTEQQEQEKFALASGLAFRRSLILIASLRAIEWLAEHVHLLFQSLGYWFIFSGIINGTMTLGDAPVILRMYSMLYETAMQLGRIWIDQQDHLAAAQRVFKIIDAEHDETSRQGGELKLSRPPAISYNNVNFAYPNGFSVLHDINLEIASGETVAFVGKTGAGKTTLAYLLPRFLKPSSGEILLEGRPIQTIDHKPLRRQVTYLFQEHQFIDGTIGENLRIANADASDSELVEACEDTQAWPFIKDMPGELNYRILADGSGLSVGQQQRLSLARASLAKSKVLILDEPTASLDTSTEKALQPFIQAKERTTLIITHRLATIRMADRVVFLLNGSVHAFAPHDELLATNESYAGFIGKLEQPRVY